MSIYRILHLLFNVLYLILLGIILWFLLYYSGVPGWVYIFYGIALFIAIIGVFIREFLMHRISKPSGVTVNQKSYTFWSTLYFVFHIIAICLLVLGVGFTVKYSNIPWWVWLVLGISVLLYITSIVVIAITHRAMLISLILVILSVFTYVIAIMAIIWYSGCPWWIWILVFAAFISLICAAIFELISEKTIKKSNSDKTCTTLGEGVQNCDLTIIVPNNVTNPSVIQPDIQPAQPAVQLVVESPLPLDATKILIPTPN